MMISPKTYYDLYLKDKNESEILEKIDELRQEIKELKTIMEHPDYIPENKPDEATQLWCNRLYLEQAKQTLEAIGGVYIPTNEEKIAKEFNENLSFIQTIEFESHSYFDGFSNITVTFDNNAAIMEISHFNMSHSSTKIQFDKEEFLDDLSMLGIGEWEESYDTEKYGIVVLDGMSWSLTISFNNDHPTKKVEGCNAYPYNFNQFIELFENIQDEYKLSYTIPNQIKNDIIQRLISKIKELPKGTEISLSQLLTMISNKCDYNGNYIYDNIEFTFEDMMSLNHELLMTAKKEGIIIDNTIHDGEVLGMLYHIEFKIIDY